MAQSTYSSHLPYPQERDFSIYSNDPDISTKDEPNTEPAYYKFEEDQTISKNDMCLNDFHLPQSSANFSETNPKQDSNHLPSPYTPKSESEPEEDQNSDTDEETSSQTKSRRCNMPPSKTVKELCLVCGDEATGRHYGVITCEGCKGFFRRAVTFGMLARCQKNETCKIRRYNRVSCQYCRFKKCLSVGMNRQIPRISRTKSTPTTLKKSKNCNIGIQQLSANVRNETISSTGSGNTINSVFPICIFQNRQNIFISKIHDEVLQKLCTILIYQEKLLTEIQIKELDDLEKMIIDGNLQFNLCTKEKIRIKTTETQPVWATSVSAELHSQPALVWANWQSSLPYENILQIIESYTFFQEISSYDQICLLRNGIFEIILVSWFLLFSQKRQAMLTPDFSAYMNRDFIKSIQTLGLFILEMFDLGIRANQLTWTDSTIALFNALLLMNPERPGLYDQGKVNEIEAKLMQVLYRHLRRCHSSEPTMFFDMLQLIPLIEQVNHIHLNAVRYIKQYESNIYITLPCIHQEIYKHLPAYKNI